MWEFILMYDHVISAACDIVCTAVMIGGILRNRKRIDKLEQEVCPTNGRSEEEK